MGLIKKFLDRVIGKKEDEELNQIKYVFEKKNLNYLSEWTKVMKSIENASDNEEQFKHTIVTIHELVRRKGIDINENDPNYYYAFILEYMKCFEEWEKYKRESKERFEIYETLFKKYSHLFKAKSLFDYDYLGPASVHSAIISCPKTWYKVIEEMLKEIDTYLKTKPDKKYKIDLIKEKWTELDVVDRGGDKNIGKIISKAERKVENICVYCGKTTKVKPYWETNLPFTNYGDAGSRYMYNLCEECSKGKEEVSEL